MSAKLPTATPSAAIAVIGPMRSSVLYDLPIFLAYLAIIPGMAVFLLRLETDFVDYYDSFYNAVREGATLAIAQATGSTAGLFDVLAVRPLLGRTYTAEEATEDGPGVVVLSHGLWQRRFAAAGLTLRVQPEKQDRDVIAYTPAERAQVLALAGDSAEAHQQYGRFLMLGGDQAGARREFALAEGLGLRRCHPDLRRFQGLGQLVLDHGTALFKGNHDMGGLELLQAGRGRWRRARAGVEAFKEPVAA